MANSLLEAYKSRLAVSEQVYKKAHLNESMTEAKKIATAKCLQNIDRFINEAFANSVGTQRSDLGMYKKFALNLTTVGIPNLIAYDLVIVQPMSSISGFITYLKYTAGSNKGSVKQGDVFNSPFALGNVDPNYTTDRVVETAKATTESANVVVKLMWSPVLITADNKLQGGKIIKVSDGSEITNYTVTKDGVITITSGAADQDEVKVAYVYDNVVIPQNDLPLLNVEVANIPLVAKARRIAVYYSQMAAFQAKTDYGFDMGDQLAEKAVGQLNYKNLIVA